MPRNPRRQLEADEQTKVFNWAKMYTYMMPELELLYHIPNGGCRNKQEAANLKRQGVKAGVPDICLPVARGGYHALYIELKAGINKTTEKQDKWLIALAKQGNFTRTCYGCDAAINTISRYLHGGYTC
jgi:hypothetical protein